MAASYSITPHCRLRHLPNRPMCRLTPNAPVPTPSKRGGVIDSDTSAWLALSNRNSPDRQGSKTYRLPAVPDGLVRSAARSSARTSGDRRHSRCESGNHRLRFTDLRLPHSDIPLACSRSADGFHSTFSPISQRSHFCDQNAANGIRAAGNGGFCKT